MTGKVDLKKTLDAYQARQGEFRVVDVPPAQYVMVDGHGDPNTSTAFTDAVSTLFPVSYALKFASKRELGRDYVVMPLEGLWWSDDMDAFTARRDKSRWDWTLMVMTPDWVSAQMYEDVMAQVAAKSSPPRLTDVRLGHLSEGLCVQTLHVGAFDDEAPVLARMHDDVIPGHGLRMTGQHHEVYLSDSRRVSPDQLRTILRQPVTRDLAQARGPRRG